jgi:hypothetical protein
MCWLCNVQKGVFGGERLEISGENLFVTRS